MRIMHVLGTRPNFVKMAPLIAALRERLPDSEQTIVHTGQHYDRMMSEIFFEQLGVPAPDHMLEIGSGTHAQQTAPLVSFYATRGILIGIDATGPVDDVTDRALEALRRYED